MDRRRLLLAGAVCALLVSTITASPAFACDEVASGAGVCSGGSNSDSHATVWAEVHRNGDDVPSETPPADVPDPSVDDTAPPARQYDWESGDYVGTYGPCNPDDPECAGAPPITLRDVASFRPILPTATMEPDGWALVGLPANFIAPAERQLVTGTLLDRPAEVRFTPVSYRWEHSDGATVTAREGGASWRALGLREFSATPTSHSYAARGPHTVRLTIGFAAEYRFDRSDWVPIPGTLDLATPARDVLVATARTVLVDRDCRAGPRGPGC